MHDPDRMSEPVVYHSKEACVEEKRGRSPYHTACVEDEVLYPQQLQE
jgi:hypothetical protein